MLLTFNDNPVAGFHLGGSAGAFLLLLHLDVEAGLVNGESVLAADEFGEVEGEAVGVAQGKCLLACNLCLPCSLRLLHDAVEELDACLERAEEAFLLLLHDLCDEFALSLEFGIGVAHLLDEYGQQTVDEGLLLPEERIGIADGTAQDAADDVAGLGIAGQLSVGDGEGDGTQVVGDDAHGNVRFLLFAVAVAAQVADGLDDGLEDVGVVVGVLALDGADESLEAHARVDDVHAERFEVAVGLALVLHEDDVPYLDDLRVVLVHQFASGHLSFLFGCAAVEVYLRAWAAGTCVAHLPEVVVLVAVDDVVGGDVLQPVASGLVVADEVLFGATFEDGDVEVLGVEL